MAEKYICQSIEERRSICESSNSYRKWLSELSKMAISDKIIQELIREIERIQKILNKEFIPKDLLRFLTKRKQDSPQQP